jgi:cyanate permease
LLRIGCPGEQLLHAGRRALRFLQGVLGYSPLQAGIAFLPMTLVNLTVALAVPRLTHRFGNGLLLAAGMTHTVLGMLWLSRLSAHSPYLRAVALPMVLIGAGQGAARRPLTAAGIAGIAPRDAGAACCGSAVLSPFPP